MNTVLLRFLLANGMSYLEAGMPANQADMIMNSWLEYDGKGPEPCFAGTCQVTNIRWAVKCSSIGAMHTIHIQPTAPGVTVNSGLQVPRPY